MAGPMDRVDQRGSAVLGPAPLIDFTPNGTAYWKHTETLTQRDRASLGSFGNSDQSSTREGAIRVNDREFCAVRIAIQSLTTGQSDSAIIEWSSA